tara:strand:+ start:369 stop:629 length:261 start_codon:yes stop_codon:yes gene_type:complete
MNYPDLINEINRMKVSNEAMFQLIRKTQNDFAILRARVDSFIDETNEISSIRDIVSRINKLENRLIMLSQRPNLDTVERNINLTIS